MISDADNFFLEFHNNSNGEDRALLLAAIFLLDFIYFERGDMGSNAGG